MEKMIMRNFFNMLQQLKRNFKETKKETQRVSNNKPFINN